MKEIKIRPSDVLAFEACPQAHAYRKSGLRPYRTKPALIFGTLVHRVVEAFLTGEVASPGDAGAMFEREWARECATTPMSFSDNKEAEKLRTMGSRMVESFVQSWPLFGLTPALDPESGDPLMERRLEVDLGDGVILTAQFDLLAWDRDANLVVVDFKTASSPATPEFLALSDQLTVYQLVVDPWARALGLSEVGGVGFVEGLKRVKPVWEAKLGPRRSEEQVLAYAEKVRFMAEQIRAGRIFRRSLMVWNSPCRLCDFRKLCAEGSDEGLYREDNLEASNRGWF